MEYWSIGKYLTSESFNLKCLTLFVLVYLESIPSITFSVFLHHSNTPTLHYSTLDILPTRLMATG
jgi:hypothetical protein